MPRSSAGIRITFGRVFAGSGLVVEAVSAAMLAANTVAANDTIALGRVCRRSVLRCIQILSTFDIGLV